MDCCPGDTTLISSNKGVFGVWALKMEMTTNKSLEVPTTRCSYLGKEINFQKV